MGRMPSNDEMMTKFVELSGMGMGMGMQQPQGGMGRPMNGNAMGNRPQGMEQN